MWREAPYRNAIWKPVAISRSSIGQNDKSVVNEFSWICNVPFRWLVRNYGAAVRTSKLGAIPKISWRSSSTETIPIIPDHTLAVSSGIMHLMCSTFGPCLSKNNYTISISFDLLHFPIILLSRDTNVYRTRLSACKWMPDDCFILMSSELKKRKKEKEEIWKKEVSECGYRFESNAESWSWFFANGNYI